MQSSKLRNYFKKKVSSLLTFNFEFLTYYLILLFLPTQLGKHFWPNFSFVNGIRIDYLSPTFYVTDILIILLFIVWATKKILIFLPAGKAGNFQFDPFGYTQGHLELSRTDEMKSKFLIFFAFAFLLIGIFLSKSPLSGLYGFIKLLEFIFFGFYTAKIYKNISSKSSAWLLFPFAIGVLFESFLAIWQYVQQGSIGGLFYYLGERSFSSLTPGIANASINGSLILRPYGTFSHPNVLAGYLTIVITMVISNFQFPACRQARPISNYKKIIYLATIVFGTLALFLTMSRVAIVLWLLVVSYWVILKTYGLIRNKKLIIHYSLLIILLVGIILFSPLRFRFSALNFTDESVIVRKDLAVISLQMIKNNPIFGVGINNFLVNLEAYEKIKTGAFFVSFQPVHNIFLLVASETGIIGLIFFVWFLSITYKRIRNNESGPLRLREARIREGKAIIRNSLFIILTMVLVLGLFDHYFLTLQQGQLLLSFVLGICWSKDV